jgi:hypothetical protein
VDLHHKATKEDLQNGVLEKYVTANEILLRKDSGLSRIKYDFCNNITAIFDIVKQNN